MTKENMVLKQTSKTLTPRLCSSLEAQLPGTLFVTIFKWFPFTMQGDRLKQVKTRETAHWDLV